MMPPISILPEKFSGKLSCLMSLAVLSLSCTGLLSTWHHIESTPSPGRVWFLYHTSCGSTNCFFKAKFSLPFLSVSKVCLGPSTGHLLMVFIGHFALESRTEDLQRTLQDLQSQGHYLVGPSLTMPFPIHSFGLGSPVLASGGFQNHPLLGIFPFHLLEHLHCF